MAALSLGGITRFCQALEAACGLHYTPAKAYLFESRLVEIVRRRGVADYDDLTRLFERDPAVRREVTEALVTSETYFFRDENTFRALPDLIDQLRPTAGAPAVIWSLGCATGQEPYSILFALAEDGRVPAAHVQLIGVDISDRALDRARLAVYSEFEARRGLDETRRARFLEPDPGGWRVARPWRELPTWVRGNLLTDVGAWPRPDVVFCRNVLIYFEDAVKRAIMRAVAARLAPGGFVVLGNAESRMTFYDLYAPAGDGANINVMRPLAPTAILD